jgi:hypothetical protein
MTKARATKPTDRSQAVKYRGVARAFLDAAEALSLVAAEDETYGNAIALLSVHLCVSYADATCIGYGEQKSRAGDHELVVPLLHDIMRERLPADIEKHLRLVVSRKDEIAYQGLHFSLHEARQLLERATRFAVWAEQMYQRRPTA